MTINTFQFVLYYIFIQVNHVLAAGRFMLIVKFRSFSVCCGTTGRVNIFDQRVFEF